MRKFFIARTFFVYTFAIFQFKKTKLWSRLKIIITEQFFFIPLLYDGSEEHKEEEVFFFARLLNPVASNWGNRMIRNYIFFISLISSFYNLMWRNFDEQCLHSLIISFLSYIYIYTLLFFSDDFARNFAHVAFFIGCRTYCAMKMRWQEDNNSAPDFGLDLQVASGHSIISIFLFYVALFFIRCCFD